MYVGIEIFMKNNFMYCFLLLSWTTIHSILIHFLNTHFLNLFDTFVVGVRHLLEAANNSILWSILPFLHIYSQTGSVLPRLLILSRKRYFLAFDVFDITLCIVRILTKVCKIFLKELKVKIHCHFQQPLCEYVSRMNTSSWNGKLING